MSRYLINIGEELVFTLKSGNTCSPELFADYAANIDFWLSEFTRLKAHVEHYNARLERTQAYKDHYFPAEDGQSVAVADPTSPREREIVVREAREQLLKVLNRGFELQMITAEQQQQMIVEIG